MPPREVWVQVVHGPEGDYLVVGNRYGRRVVVGRKAWRGDGRVVRELKVPAGELLRATREAMGEVRFLTERQGQVLEFIRRSLGDRSVAPTNQEIADEFGYSSLGTVSRLLGTLERKGYIRRALNQTRGIELLG